MLGQIHILNRNRGEIGNMVHRTDVSSVVSCRLVPICCRLFNVTDLGAADSAQTSDMLVCVALRTCFVHFRVLSLPRLCLTITFT